MPADPRVFLQGQGQTRPLARPQDQRVQAVQHGVQPVNLSPARQRGLGEVAEMREEVAGIAKKVKEDVGMEAKKLEMELQVTRMQQTLHAVNTHLEEEQVTAERAANEAEALRNELLNEINERDTAIQEAEQDKAKLLSETEMLQSQLEEQRRNFNEEKRVMNEHFVRIGQEHHGVLEKLNEMQAEHQTLVEKNTVLQGWLDRGTEECKKTTEENEVTKRILEQTAGNWEEDHQTLTDRLAKLEQEYKTAVHERGALAVNLTTARARVIEDSRNLYNVVAVLKNVVRKCVVIQGALSSNSTDPLLSLFDEPNPTLRGEVPSFDGDGLPSNSSHQVRSATNELHEAFTTVHQTAFKVLKQWAEDKDLAKGLPGKIQDAQADASATRDANDRLKLKLNELRGEVERWRQKAAIHESARGASGMPLTRLEKQQLVQAQTVAASLHREKEQLNREVVSLRKENMDLRTNYNTTESENGVMRDEIQRLRTQVARQASQFDAFNNLPLH
eukprot:TRINITY_DN19644_c0_g1_i1.p1 TRINITY_DN19644_c0_g1~~TRINITY_DN19644_c0_g1_i1.p1  ORF type:complete len:503 (+),score=149.59 TRINITY_DN19644_c0_g1_i1:65-1573(+)